MLCNEPINDDIEFERILNFTTFSGEAITNRTFPFFYRDVFIGIVFFHRDL